MLMIKNTWTVKYSIGLWNMNLCKTKMSRNQCTALPDSSNFGSIGCWFQSNAALYIKPALQRFLANHINLTLISQLSFSSLSSFGTRKEPTTSSTHMWRRERESDPGHIGGKRALSPLRQPVVHRTSLYTVQPCGTLLLQISLAIPLMGYLHDKKECW